MEGVREKRSKGQICGLGRPRSSRNGNLVLARISECQRVAAPIATKPGALQPLKHPVALLILQVRTYLYWLCGSSGAANPGWA